MKQYVPSNLRYLCRCSDEDRRYLQSRITITKFNTFVFGVLIALFIIFYFSFHEGQLKPTIIFINSNSTGPRRISHIYSFALHDKFVPDIVAQIYDKAQSPPTCQVMIRTSDGGIGNRMFLFASAYGLARLHQCNLYVAPWIVKDLRSIFTIQLNNTPVHLTSDDSISNRTGFYGRYSACTLYPDLLRVPLSPNITRYEMIGFYQAFGYFVKYKEEISYLFQFKQDAIDENVPLVEQLVKAVWNIPLDLGNFTKGNVTHRYLKTVLTRPSASLVPVTWIGIHIRRGDFLTFFKIDTSTAYLNFAMNYYRRKYVNCRFLIASDDKEYAKTHLANNSDVFITPQTFHSGDDLAALALCEHMIVTAGSYGWWAGWLAGGNVVHDLNYPVPFQNCQREHYFPPWYLFPHNGSAL